MVTEQVYRSVRLALGPHLASTHLPDALHALRTLSSSGAPDAEARELAGAAVALVMQRSHELYSASVDLVASTLGDAQVWGRFVGWKVCVSTGGWVEGCLRDRASRCGRQMCPIDSGTNTI